MIAATKGENRRLRILLCVCVCVSNPYTLFLNEPNMTLDN